MSAPPTIDLDELTRPIAGDNPGGVPLPDAVRRDLDTWRKEADPDFPETSNLPPPEWGKVIAAASGVLSGTGKDLTAAVRLVEAITKKHHAPGLRDGITLLTRLAENGWEHVHPVPEPGGDQEDRLNRLNWLNDSSKGGRFPMTVLRMPVVRTNRGETFAAIDWLDAGRRAEVEAAAGAFTLDGVKKSFAELDEVRQGLHRLATLLDEKMGPESPDLSEDNSGGLGQAVAKCLQFVRGVADLRGFPLEEAAASSGETDTAAGGGGGGGGGAPSSVGGSRDQLYRQLAQIAEALKRIEPHSPIPFLLERCVKLGSMSFPDLMREVIRESNPLEELDKLLGLVRPES